MEGNPADPFIDDDWRLQACQFVDGDPSRLEVIFTGILGGRLRLTVSAKKLGQGWFEAGEIWGDGDPALTPVEDLRMRNGVGEVSPKSRVCARFGTN